MKQLAFLLFLLPLTATAQNFHFSPRIGIAGYHGDLKENFFSFSQSRLMGSIGARYDLTERISARAYISYGSLTASDKKGTPTMQLRNLDFSTKLLDFELGAQYNILNLNYHWWTPYVFAGVGFYKYNPYTLDTADGKHFLQPLSTEGQGVVAGRDPYKLFQFSIPFGIGVDYVLSEDHKIGIEFGYRRLFNDYLDDVSSSYIDQATLLSAKGPKAVELAYRGGEINASTYPSAGTPRGNPNSKDGYYFITFTYTFRYWFDKYKYTSSIPGGKSDKKMGCPSTRY